MNERLPSLNAKQVLQALHRAGFVAVRSSGSHHVLNHPANPRRRVIVAYHGSRDIPRGTLHGIIRQAGLTPQAFLALL